MAAAPEVDEEVPEEEVPEVAVGFLQRHGSLSRREQGRSLSRKGDGRGTWHWVAAATLCLAASGLAGVALLGSHHALPPRLASSSTGDLLDAYGLGDQRYTGEDVYEPGLAKVFAMFSKLSYCGPLPGIFGSVAFSCGQTGLPGVVTRCEQAGLAVYPGLVRTIQQKDLNVYTSIFGVAARFHRLAGEAGAGVAQEGCIAAFRGSIDNFANSVRDKQTDMVSPSFKDCPGCRVHAGYAFVWSKMKQVLLDELFSIGCGPSTPLYLTGHGSGAAVATLAMFDLATAEGYKVEGSYIYESPLQGNRAFAQSFYDEVVRKRKAPLFSVKSGRDAFTRWPRGAQWFAAGLEVYFTEGLEDLSAPEFCGPSVQAAPSCDLAARQLAAPSAGDTCASPLAPDRNFCNFSHFAAACYGGIGFEEEELLRPPTLPPILPPTPPGAASAAAPVVNASELFRPELARAFAALTKLTYCGQRPGVYASVVKTCRTFCEDAGFSVVPGTVRSAGVSDDAAPSAISFFVAKFRRVGGRADVPDEGCLLAIRGDAEGADYEPSAAQRAADEARSRRSRLVAARLRGCAGCELHQGYLEVWEKIQTRALEELGSIGCMADDKSPLYLTGHAMGGSVAEIGMYALKQMGFGVQTGYTFEAERVSNEAFGEALNGLYENGVGLFRVTHGEGSAPRSNESAAGFTSLAHEVRVGSDARSYTVCEAGGAGCGTVGHGGSEPRSDGRATCGNPFAPQGDLCHVDESVCVRGLELPGALETTSTAPVWK